MLDTLNSLDGSLLLAINGWHSTYFDHFMYTFSGKLVWVPMYVAIWYVMLRNLHWKQLLWCSIGVALVIVFADQVAGSLIRDNVCRLRPSNLENPLSELVHIVNGKRGGRYGFPSCHAANTMALAFYVYLLFRKRWLTFALMMWALVTCYSRAYLGVHYPGDLFVGCLVGMSGAAIVYLLLVKCCHYRPAASLRYSNVPIWVLLATVAGIVLYSLFAII